MIKEGNVYDEIYQVTEKIYNLFIEAYSDRNPLHVNEAFAKEKSFTGKVMHGAILTGFLSHFIGERLPFKNVIIQSLNLNFIKPVYMNDMLNFKATVMGFYESVNTVEFKYQFFNGSSTIAKGDITISII